MRYGTILSYFEGSLAVSKKLRNREKQCSAAPSCKACAKTRAVRHPMPATVDADVLRKHLVGRWQSPRRPYFYHADGTWASDEDIPGSTGGTWHIEGNQFFQNYRGDTPDRGENIILLTSTDFVYGSARAPYYLRRGTAFPWRE
jgi:hypothetical protein